MKNILMSAVFVVATSSVAKAEAWQAYTEEDVFAGSAQTTALIGADNNLSMLYLECNTNENGFKIGQITKEQVDPLFDLSPLGKLMVLNIAIDGVVLKVDHNDGYAFSNSMGNIVFGTRVVGTHAKKLLSTFSSAKKRIDFKPFEDVVYSYSAQGSSNAMAAISACLEKQGAGA